MINADAFLIINGGGFAVELRKKKGTCMRRWRPRRGRDSKARLGLESKQSGLHRLPILVAAVEENKPSMAEAGQLSKTCNDDMV